MLKPVACATLALTITITAATAAPAALPVPVAPPPSQFVARVTNPWFPLRPGTVYRYTGVKDRKRSRDVVTVTRSTTMIAGIQATPVSDRLYVGGRLEERTTDWFAQDRKGNVWYLGERTAELNEHGHVTTTSGSWRTGVDGAAAGIQMPAHPVVGEAARQEFLPGVAEDQFKVVSLDAHAHTRGASSNRALLIQETTVLEAGVVDQKLYVKGVGTVIDEAVKGPRERLTLQSMHVG